MTLNEKQAEFIEMFNSLGSWQERFQYLIDLGEQLPAMPEHERTPACRIHSCISQTFFRASVVDGIILIEGWSNAAIPSGLIAIFREIFDGCNINELQQLKIENGINFYTETKLLDNLTAQRKSSLQEMIGRLP